MNHHHFILHLYLMHINRAGIQSRRRDQFDVEHSVALRGYASRLLCLMFFFKSHSERHTFFFYFFDSFLCLSSSVSMALRPSHSMSWFVNICDSARWQSKVKNAALQMLLSFLFFLLFVSTMTIAYKRSERKGQINRPYVLICAMKMK